MPLADTTLVTVPGSGHSEEMLRPLLTLSDVFATGHHAAVCAQVKPGHTAAVVGDGAVGLSGVLAAKRLGAERIPAVAGTEFRYGSAQSADFDTQIELTAFTACKVSASTPRVRPTGSKKGLG